MQHDYQVLDILVVSDVGKSTGEYATALYDDSAQYTQTSASTSDPRHVVERDVKADNTIAETTEPSLVSVTIEHATSTGVQSVQCMSWFVFVYAKQCHVHST
jgi:hypothetical protein